MATSTTGRATDGLHPSQMIALAVGVAYTLVGLVGFAVTGFDDFAGKDTEETLLGFELNGLHNVVHLVIGLAGLALWRRLDHARAYGWALFVGYGATFVYGLFAVDEEDINILSLNSADNGLHLASALIGLAAALWPVRDTTGTRTGTTGATRA
jgi:hypothetical protein